MAVLKDGGLNVLSMLQRVDPCITGVLDNARTVALYKYSAKGCEWEKTEIEGTLFVFVIKKLEYGFIIINFSNYAKQVELVSKELEFQQQSPFLLYRNERGNFFGIWFSKTDDCMRIGKLLKRLTHLTPVQRFVKPFFRQKCISDSESYNKGRNALVDPRCGVGIVTMLCQAQKEFEDSDQSKALTLSGSRALTPLGGNKVLGLTGKNDMKFSQPPSYDEVTRTSPIKSVHIYNNVEQIKEPKYQEKRLFFMESSTRTSRRSLSSEELSNVTMLNDDNRGLNEYEKFSTVKEHKAKKMLFSDNYEMPNSFDRQKNEFLNEDSSIQSLDSYKDNPNPLFTTSTDKKKPLPCFPVLSPSMFESSYLKYESSSLPMTRNEDCYYRRENQRTPVSMSIMRNQSQAVVVPQQSSAHIPLLTPMAFTGASPKQTSDLYCYINPDEGTFRSSANNPTYTTFYNDDYICDSTFLNKHQLKQALLHIIQNDDHLIMKVHEAYLGSLRSRLKTL